MEPTTPDLTKDYTDTALLFSPSKARAQQLQAKDWASVDSWLARKYASKRLPPFERNEDTLQALLNLATLNDSADEQRSLIDRVDKAALQALSRRRAGSGVAFSDEYDCMGFLIAELQDNEAKILDGLAQMAVELDSPDTRPATMAERVVELTERRFTFEQQLHRTEAQLQAVRAEQAKVKVILQDLRREESQPNPKIGEMTNDWIRNSKQLRAKIGEYDDRLKALNAAPQPTVKFEDIKLQIHDLAMQCERLAEVKVELNAFQDLPSDAKAARAQLESAREELRGLVKERDAMFERLVETR